MRIGIDCRNILNQEKGRGAGVGHYIYHLVKELTDLDKDNQFVLFFEQDDRNVAKEFKNQNSKIKITILNSKIKIPFFYSHIYVSWKIIKERCDFVHFTANVIPLLYFGKSVLTIHDLVIYKNPDWFPEGQWLSRKVVVPVSIKRATSVIAISETTKKDLIEIFKVESAKILVVPLGVDLTKYQPLDNPNSIINSRIQKFGLTPPYIIFVGTIEPRKNLIRLIEAFQALSNSMELDSGYQLVIAGGKGWKYEPIFEAAKDNQEIIFTGYITEQEKIALMQGAEVFAFPSLYEGFALPVLEAMACGVPVVCSNNSALPEVGVEAVIYCSAEDSNDIARAISEALAKKEILSQLGRKHAENFSWVRTAQETIEIYETIDPV